MKLRIYAAAVAVVIATACMKELPSDPTPAPGVKTDATEAASAIPGVAKVYFSEEMTALIEADLAKGGIVTKSSELNSLVEELGITSMRRLFPDAGEYEPRTRAEGLHRWYKVTFDKSVPVTKAGEDLLAIPGVERFEKCLPIRSAVSPNDTYYSSYMWGLKNSNGYDVNVEPVWSGYTVGNPDVIVCVVDGGIQLNHPDLAWNCASSGHYNYVDNNRTIYPHDHGSHVAGTIAAVTNNGRGVAGIAGGDYAAGRRGITLLSHQIFKTVTRNGVTYDEGGDGETAIKEGADHGALISQNSWGYYFDLNENDRLDQEDIDAYQYYFEHPDAAFTAAVDYFVKYAGCDNRGNQLPNSLMKGGLVVFAAGNDNIPYGPPANYEPCLAVGAIDKSGTRASFSDYGNWVDLCAPGVSIASTIPTNDYAIFDGTSMACPHVSGVAALVLSYCGGPGYTADDLREALINGARKIGPSTGSKPIGPLVDAFGALMYGDRPVPMTDYSVEATGNSLDFGFTTNGNYGYTAFASASRSSIENLDPQHPGSDVFSVSYDVPDPADMEGKSVSLRLRKLAFSTTYYVTMAGYAYGHRYGAAAPVRTVTTGVNHPPVVNIPSVLGPFHQFENVHLPLDISEPDGNDFTVTYRTTGPARVLFENGVWTFVLNGMTANPGTFTMTVTARDEFDTVKEASFSYTLLQNQLPFVRTPFEVSHLPAPGSRTEVVLSEHFSDPDGEPLSYQTLNNADDIVSVVLTDDVLKLIAVREGYGKIKVTARDAMGELTEAEIPVLVRDPATPLSVYPGNVVTSSMTVLPGLTPAAMSFRLVGPTGTVVYAVSGTYSVSDPLVVDVSSLAPGRYALTATTDGQTHKLTIVKK